MTDLSPQAQVIVDAYENTTDKYKALAAVLHSLANQFTFADTRVGVTEKVVLVDDILKIATELDNI
jgi:hypothetical protein